MLRNTLIIISTLAIVVLLILLNFTTPESTGPFGLLVIFITAYLACLGIISFILFGGSMLYVYIVKSLGLRRIPEPWTLRRSYYYSTVLALAPVLLISLQSVGSAGIYGNILVVLFEVIGLVYISRRM